ncbi:MAG: aminotransferase class IV, partial [Pseudomonadota bacterium]|nr:aminotransferase class IV [Pseudomonadota bacterium]
LGLAVPVDRQTLTRRLHACLAKNGRRDAVLRLSLSRGISGRGLATAGCTDPTLLILCFPPRRYPPQMLAEGAHVILASVRRTPAAALDPLAKTANYLNNILAFREAEMQGAAEALMLNTAGELAEGAVSNLFLVRDGALWTPALACGVMAGVTRAAVLEVAGTTGIDAREARLYPQDLASADEAFFTNTTAAVMPIGLVDGYCYAAPGPVTQTLRAGLLALIQREAGRFWPADAE